jgi:hypothetical protein
LTINIGDAAPILPDPDDVLLDDDALAGGNRAALATIRTRKACRVSSMARAAMAR